MDQAISTLATHHMSSPHHCRADPSVYECCKAIVLQLMPLFTVVKVNIDWHVLWVRVSSTLPKRVLSEDRHGQ